MISCDVLVVGGGPAGSSAAWALGRIGLDVVVLDKASFPRHKVCAGWITPAVLEELEIDPGDYGGEGRTLQPIRGFRVGGMDGEAHELSYDEPVSYGILRCELDHYLLRRSGARLELGRPLRSLERCASGWLANGEIEARLVIGAGGHFCPVARALSGDRAADRAGERAGDQAPAEPIVVAQEFELELRPAEAAACAVAPEVPELYFAADLRGYGWCFRKGRMINVGLGRQDRRGLREHVEDFLARLRDWGRIPRTVGDRLKGHAYLLWGDGGRPIVAERALLIGDAAGLAYPASGEGIRPAVESGLLAARVLAPLFARGSDFPAAELEPYRRLLSDRLGRRRRLPLLGMLPEGFRRAGARRFLASPWLVRELLVERWFLHRRQPLLDSGAGPPSGSPRRRPAPLAASPLDPAGARR